MAVLAVLGLTLLSERLAQWIMQPVVALGNKLSERTAGEGGSAWSAIGLGIATGLLQE
jgi:hypothetical protein